MAPKLMLIDGNSVLNRAFYGLKTPVLLSTSDGIYTNAVYGFINILNKFQEEEKPDYICVAFDLKGPTFRHKEFAEYKANRIGMPDELAMQLPIIKEVLDAMNIKQVEIEGFEADDIIGSLARWAEEQGVDTVIITGDRDALQLVTEHTRVKIPTKKDGRTETEEYDYNAVIDRFGVTPTQIIDAKGLMGDKSDNIPGVKGIGDKTAFSLIKDFGSIENLYDNLDKVARDSIREKLEAGKEIAFISKKLATIDTGIRQSWSFDDFTFKPDRIRLRELFKRLEFKSLIEKFNLDDTGKEEKPVKFASVDCIKDSACLEKIRELIMERGCFSLCYLMEKPGIFNHKLIGLGIALDEDRIFYIDILNCISEECFLGIFSDIFENSSIKKYTHDIKDFLVYLKKKDIEFDGLAFDTLVGAYIINPTRDSYNVNELANEYCGVNIESMESLTGKGKNFIPLSQIETGKLSAFAGIQAEAILKISAELDKKIRENNQENLYYDIELPLIFVLAEMEYHGFRIDADGLVEYSKELDDKIAQLISEIYALAGEEFKINSPKQLGAILFDKLGLPAGKKTKTGWSTDAEVLESLEDKHEIVRKILEYRQLMKLKSTYAEGLLNVIDIKTGKVHSSFNQSVTATGRISSTEPNLQNIPIKLDAGRKIRKVFIPTNEDYVLVDADYSQIELRVLAHISNDENMIEAFMRNEDIHADTASKVFDVPREAVTPLLRSRAKAVNFGIVYGIGDFSLAKDLGITRKEARRYIDGYLNKYRGVKQYMDNAVEEGKKNGFVTTLFGRRRYLPELMSKNFNIRSFGQRIAMNTPIQGSAADIIKIAMVKVYNALKEKKMKSRLILQVHDELIIEAHNEEKDQVIDILKDCMENAVKLKVPLCVDVHWGKNWYETK